MRESTSLFCNLRASREVFERLTWPLLRERLPGQIYAVEHESVPALLALDRHAKIDFLHVDAAGVRGIAHRAQQIAAGRTSYDTFTIALKSVHGAVSPLAYLRAMALRVDEGYLLPGLHVQSYVDHCGDLLSFGVVTTTHLLQAIQGGACRPHLNTHTGQNFLSVSFADLLRRQALLAWWHCKHGWLTPTDPHTNPAQEETTCEW